jgi:predicted ferric reductase
VFIVVGYAAIAHHGLYRETLVIEQQYADVLMATFAFVLLLIVGVTSARAARRRMRYETWYLIHLYTYLAIGLAFAHQFAVGVQFVDNRTARVCWASFYLVSVAFLLWFRVFVPLRTMWRHRLTVADVAVENHQVLSVTLAGVDVGGLRAQPGQYLRLRFLTATGWWQSHPFSLSALPTRDSLRVTVKRRGDHTSELEGSLHPGVRVIVEGPYGALTERRRARNRVLLVAGGIGITPLRALFESMQGEPGDVTLLYRTSRCADVVFREELDALAAERGFTVHYLTGPRDGPAAIDAPALQLLVPDVAERDCYLCGPAGLETSVTRALRACGVPGSRIHSEQFDF